MVLQRLRVLRAREGMLPAARSRKEGRKGCMAGKAVVGRLPQKEERRRKPEEEGEVPQLLEDRQVFLLRRVLLRKVLERPVRGCKAVPCKIEEWPRTEFAEERRATGRERRRVPLGEEHRRRVGEGTEQREDRSRGVSNLA